MIDDLDEIIKFVRYILLQYIFMEYRYGSFFYGSNFHTSINVYFLRYEIVSRILQR